MRARHGTSLTLALRCGAHTLQRFFHFGGDLTASSHIPLPPTFFPLPPAPSRRIAVEFLDTFNVQKKAIEKCIDAVSLATKQTISLSDQVKSAINPDDIDKISKTLADVVKNAQREAAKGKQLLDALKKEESAIKLSNPRSDRLPLYKAQYMRLCKNYVDAMKEHQKAKETLRKVQTDDLVRRGMILYGDTKSESEIRAKVEQDPANFVREAIMEEAADEAQAAYAEAQSRARDVEFLVRSLTEVAAMFQDLAVLVQHQSEMLDSIESNIETAGKHVRKGNDAVSLERLRGGMALAKPAQATRAPHTLTPITPPP